jgi:CheY-like chemotaxis protein
LKGLEAARALINPPARKPPPRHAQKIPDRLAAVGAGYDDAIRQRALNTGVAGYLVKPFNEKELLDSIDTALKHKVLHAPIKP